MVALLWCRAFDSKSILTIGPSHIAGDIQESSCLDYASFRIFSRNETIFDRHTANGSRTVSEKERGVGALLPTPTWGKRQRN